MISRSAYGTPDATGAMDLAYHYEMLADSSRLGPFIRAIDTVSKGQVVVESGTGSGILSLAAAKAGADTVYTFDVDPVIGELARKNFAASSYGSNIIFANKDIRDVTILDLDGRKAAVVIAENLSTWQVTEPEIAVMNHITATLAAENAVRIPKAISNYLELVCAQYTFADLVTMRSYFFQFSGIRPPRAMSAKSLFRSIDLSRINPTSVSGEVAVTANRSGVVNALRLTSPIEVIEGITFEASDSLMPPVVVPLRTDLRVRAGERFIVTVDYDTCSSWTDIHYSVRPCR